MYESCGLFFAPTVLADVTAGARMLSEEPFGIREYLEAKTVKTVI
jgi:hypothetical protein